MIQTIAYFFVALIVILDPAGTAAFFLGLTRHEAAEHRRRMAVRGVVIAGGVMVVFAFAGDFVLRALGVGLPAFRVAGGSLLFLLAIHMLFARQTSFRELTDVETREADASADISVFPLAIPLIAGPGALTTIVLLTERTAGDPAAEVALFAVLAVVLAICLVFLLAASQLVDLLGATGVNVISRVFGILLAGLAVQLMFDGLQAAFIVPLTAR